VTFKIAIGHLLTQVTGMGTFLTTEEIWMRSKGIQLLAEVRFGLSWPVGPHPPRKMAFFLGWRKLLPPGGYLHMGVQIGGCGHSGGTEPIRRSRCPCAVLLCPPQRLVRDRHDPHSLAVGRVSKSKIVRTLVQKQAEFHIGVQFAAARRPFPSRACHAPTDVALMCLRKSYANTEKSFQTSPPCHAPLRTP
jgi:hypothetical protein